MDAVVIGVVASVAVDGSGIGVVVVVMGREKGFGLVVGSVSGDHGGWVLLLLLLLPVVLADGVV